MIKSLKLKFHMLIGTLLITKLSLGVPAMSLQSVITVNEGPSRVRVPRHDYLCRAYVTTSSVNT